MAVPSLLFILIKFIWIRSYSAGRGSRGPSAGVLAFEHARGEFGDQRADQLVEVGDLVGQLEHASGEAAQRDPDDLRPIGAGLFDADALDAAELAIHLTSDRQPWRVVANVRSPSTVPVTRTIAAKGRSLWLSMRPTTFSSTHGMLSTAGSFHQRWTGLAGARQTAADATVTGPLARLS
jgi:hypothetical protein